LWIYDNTPGLFRCLPARIRLPTVRTALGPAGGWWLKDRVVGQVPLLLGYNIRSAAARDGRVTLRVADQNDSVQDLVADHVIAATGYRFNLYNLPFVSREMKAQLRHEEQSPLLSPHFESSIEGLYFAGLGSANSFGPAMRFLVGSNYAARRISKHIARIQGVRPKPLARAEKCPEYF
jgi:hypothetical protein